MCGARGADGEGGEGMSDVIVEIDSRAKNEAAVKPAPSPPPEHKLRVYLLSAIPFWSFVPD